MILNIVNYIIILCYSNKIIYENIMCIIVIKLFFIANMKYDQFFTQKLLIFAVLEKKNCNNLIYLKVN